MSTSARIDELRRKFDENPRRFFAPLANEYRKLGDLEQAIALCRAHLPHQSGHISGHIVLAQALQDAGEGEESRQVFEQSLELDPENLIALRCLGDIARSAGDLHGASLWYQRVLEVDPRNDEITALIRQVEREETLTHETPRPPLAADLPAPAAESTPPAAEYPPSPAVDYADSRWRPPATPDRGAPAIASSGEAAHEPRDAAAFATPVSPMPWDPASDEWRRSGQTPRELHAVESTESTLARSPLTTPESETAGDAPQAFDVFEAFSDERGFADLADLGDLEAAADPFLDEWATPNPDSAPEWDREADPLAMGTFDAEPSPAPAAEAGIVAEPDVVAEFEELSLEIATQPIAHRAPEETAAEESTPRPPAVDADAGEHAESPVESPIAASSTPSAPASRESEPVAGDIGRQTEPAAESTQTAFVTETMAELYLRQGFHDEALAVYRQLLARRPHDDGLWARVRELSRPPDESAAKTTTEETPSVPAHEAVVDAAAATDVESAAGHEADSPPTQAEVAVGTDAETDAGRSGEPVAMASIESVAEVVLAVPDEPVAVVAPETVDDSPPPPSPATVPRGPTARQFFAALGERRPRSRSAPPSGSVQLTEPESARVPVGAQEGASEADDIEQFNSWLEGLRKP